MKTAECRIWPVAPGVLLAICFMMACGGDPGRRAFEQGLREYERGRNVRAIALLEKSLNMRPASPENATAHYYIGLAARKLGRIDRAIEAFEASRRQDPDAMEPIYALAVLYFEGGDLERAQPLFEECVRRAPDDPRPLEFLAGLHRQAGRLAVARRVLLAALSRHAESPRILTSLALVEQAAGDLGKAQFYLQQALARDPQYAPALFNMAWLQYSVSSNRAEAARFLEKFLAVETNEARRLEAQAMLASMRRLEAPAEDRTKPATVQTPGPAEVPQARPLEVPATSAPPAPLPPTLDEQLAQAKKLGEQGKAEEAVALCLQTADEAERAGNRSVQRKALQQALAIGFDRSKVHAAWGRYLAGQGDWTNALRSFKQAVILQRDDAQAQRDLAEAAMRVGEYDAALVALRQVVQLKPEWADAWWSMAQLYDENVKIPTRAAESYREFIRRFPGDPRVVKAQKRLEVLEPRGAAQGPAGGAPAPAPEAPSAVPPLDGPASAPALPRAVVSRPSGEIRLNIRRPSVRNQQAAVQAYNRGTLYQQRGEWDQAIFYYTRALENDDTFVTAYFNLAAVYWARGDHALAKDAYRHALELEPQGAAVRYNLALLHYELREWEAAIQELKTLLDHTPDYAQAHYLLGLLYSQNPQQVALASAHYRKFLELAPTDPAAPAVKRWLEQQPHP